MSQGQDFNLTRILRAGFVRMSQGQDFNKNPENRIFLRLSCLRESRSQDFPGFIMKHIRFFTMSWSLDYPEISCSNTVPRNPGLRTRNSQDYPGINCRIFSR